MTSPRAHIIVFTTTPSFSHTMKYLASSCIAIMMPVDGLSLRISRS